MLGWLIGRAVGSAIFAKVALVAIPLLIALVGGGMLYAKHLYDSRLLYRQAAEAARVAAEGWSRQWDEQQERLREVERLRIQRERERDTLRSEMGRIRDEIRNANSDEALDYLSRPVPADIDQRLCDAERAAGSDCPPRDPAR